MLGQIARFVAMSNVTAKASVREKVRERVLASKCLIDGCEDSPTTRGLCQKHYIAFLREQASRQEGEQANFESAAIKEGLILAVGEVREIKSPSPFANVG